MAEKKVIDIQINSNAKDVTTDINNAAQATTNLGNANAEAGSKSKTLNDVKNVITGMVPSLKAAENGATGFSTSLKALLANPVVLVITGIVGALKFIYEAFQSNVKIGKEIAAVWEGLSAVGSQVTDAVMGMVRGIVYAGQALAKLITGDVKGASKALSKANEEMSASYDQLTKAVNGTTFAIVRGLEKQQQANNKAKKEQAVRESEINKLLVQSREILTDETASIKDKKKALDEVTKAEKASSAEKVRTAQVDLDILKKKAKALGGQAEIKMKQEIREATIALNEAETENAMTGIKLNKQRKMLLRQEVADGKEAAAAAKERAKEKAEADKAVLKAKQDVLDKIKKAENDANKNAIEKQQEFDNRIEAIAEQNYLNALSEQEKEIQLANDKYFELETLATGNKDQLAIIELAKMNELNDINLKYQDAAYKADKAAKDKQAALDKEATEKQIAIEKTLADTKKQIRDADFANAQAGINLIAGLFEGNKKVQAAALIAQNAVAIAKTIIETKAANQAARASGTALSIATAGASVAAAEALILRNNIGAGLSIAAIAAATGKGLSALKAGGSASGGGNLNEGGGGSVMSPNFNVVGNSGLNQLGQLQQKPTKAYVVSGDMTTAQALDRNRIENATLVQ
jgi:hypothetical protein